MVNDFDDMNLQTPRDEDVPPARGDIMSSSLDDIDKILAESQSEEDQILANTMVEDILKDPQDVDVQFITGEAGTGKTWTVKEMAKRNKSMILCATTGIAAVNLDTITLNSLLKFFNTASLIQNYTTGMLTRRLRELYIDRGLRILGIDEISMMPAAQLEVIYQAMQTVNQRLDQPMRLTLTGDFAQLPPVSTPEEPADWCFTAPCWEVIGRNVERLTKVWRQTDPQFLVGLNMARKGFGMEAAKALRGAGVKYTGGLDEQFPGTTIFAINRRVDEFNQKRLGQLTTPDIRLDNKFGGIAKSEWKNQIPGCPGGKVSPLVVKEGALVMILANDTEGGANGEMAYGNGDLGTALGMRGAGVVVKLQRTGDTVIIGKIRRWHECEKDSPGAKWEESLRGQDGRQGGWACGWMEWYPLRLGWATTVHKCLHPDTWIRTKKGLCKAKAVFSAHVDQVWTGDSWAGVKAKAETVRPLVELTTQSGRQLRCSPEHPIWTNGGWIKAGDMEVGYHIHLQDPVGQIERQPWDSRWWLYGALLGDGWLCHPGGEVHFAKTDGEIQVKVVGIVEALGVHVGYRKDGRGLHWASAKLRREFPLGYERAANKSLPLVDRLTDGEVQSLLAGIWDTDGSVGSRGMTLTTKSKKLAHGVLTLMLGQGIKSSLSEYYSPKSGIYWQVRVGAVGISEFRRLIPLQHQGKATRLAELQFNRILQTWEMDTIVGVTKLGEIPMVDLELETEPHQFWADGFITHNSQGLSMDNVQIDCRDRFFGNPNMAYVALSRARTPQGLRVVGGEFILGRQIKAAQEVKEWL